MLRLAGLDQGERLEQLVHRAVAAGEDNERGRVLHEHRLADEEVAEVNRPLHVGVEALLERQLNVAADREAVALLAAAVRRLHDPGAATGDDREAFLGELAGRLDGLLVAGLVGLGARRAEDGDGAVDVRQRVEPLDELHHNAQYATRVRRGASAAVARAWIDAPRVLSDRPSARAAP